MKVLKFGGTSVSGPSHIRAVKDIIRSTPGKQVVVVSAMGGVTDLLLQLAELASQQKVEYKSVFKEIEQRHLQCAKELLPISEQSSVLSHIKSELNVLETLAEGAFLIGEITPKLSDKMVSYGELLSAYIISQYLRSCDIEANFKDSRELIITDDRYGNAQPDLSLTYSNLATYFRNVKSITVLPGFIAASAKGDNTTLGRGGSDYTAALVAAAIDASELQIWTDVSGMYTANPKLVRQAKCIPHISYEEAMELSHFGAKVLYPPTIQPVLAKDIPIRIKNTFAPADEGTLVARGKRNGEKTVRGISHVAGIALISLEGPGMIGIPGISRRFFEVLSQASISVVMITQASSEHSICIGLKESDAQLAVEVLNQAFENEIKVQKLKEVRAEQGMAIIALVGDHMKSHQGLSGRMFSSLGRNNVNIRAIAQGASERNISAVIRKADSKKALNTLHEAFFEAHVKQLNLFIAGVGNVGSRFLAQLDKQRQYLYESMHMNLRVIGIANSRKMVFDEDDISLSDWEENLEKGEPSDPEKFLDRVKDLNYRNSIFVDNTASEVIAGYYAYYLGQSISVVSCNKIASSGDYQQYRKLKELSREYSAPFLFETNVGAGLPILDTLRHLITSGDQVHRIEAVLSGSLNFVWNQYSGETPFYEVVQQAGEAGYTEPDPRIDLSGTDVMRKILILARESGYALEMKDITNKSFLPQGSMDAPSIGEFMELLKKHEDDFRQMVKKAASKNARLKYVAEFDGKKASVGLQMVPEGHDYYNLEGSDNIVRFFTERYPEQPLIIKGAGAGAEVTASGIFADIVRIGNF